MYERLMCALPVIMPPDPVVFLTLLSRIVIEQSALGLLRSVHEVVHETSLVTGEPAEKIGIYQYQ